MENMEEIPKKEKRKRIEITEKMLGAKVVVDELAFVKNKCSDVARHIEDIPNLIKISLWLKDYMRSPRHWSVNKNHSLSCWLRIVMRPNTSNWLKPFANNTVSH